MVGKRCIAAAEAISFDVVDTYHGDFCMPLLSIVNQLQLFKLLE